MARTIDLEERKQFRVLLNPVRQDIIHLLRRAGRPMTANTVAEKMLLSPSAAQSHLNKLEELGVVELGVYTAPDGRQATYYRLADVEIRLCLGRKDGFQGEREALAAQLVDGTFRGVLHAASQCGEPEQQEDLQFLFGALHLKPEERAELLGLLADGHEPSIAVSGMIGWVGLVVPHLCRKLVGSNFRVLLPCSMLAGAAFLLLVDNLSRNLLATEIPIGILTAFVGAPFFIYLMVKGGDRL